MLTEKEQELIAIGASIAAGCQPCTTFHMRAARIAEANDDEIRRAVGNALRVRRNATEVMARIGASQSVDASTSDANDNEDKSRIGALVSISSAYAVNCVANLETHIASAREQGATDGQILSAIKISCAVKDVAGKKIQAAAYKAFGRSEQESEECGCGDVSGKSDKTARCDCQN